MSVSFPTPEEPVGVKRLWMRLPVHKVASHRFSDTPLLIFRQKDIAMSADGKILAFLLLETSIGSTLTVERVQVVYIVLWCKWWPIKGILMW